MYIYVGGPETGCGGQSGSEELEEIDSLGVSNLPDLSLSSRIFFSSTS